MIKVDIADKTNQNNISSVDLGFGIKYKLKRLIYSKKVTSMQVFQFKKEASPCSYPMEKKSASFFVCKVSEMFISKLHGGMVESSRSCKLIFEKIL